MVCGLLEIGLQAARRFANKPRKIYVKNNTLQRCNFLDLRHV